MEVLKDRFNRTLDYVRISITDRCNFRCRYCMPEEGISFIPHSRIMSYENITFLAAVLERMGVRKLRFTGGEPFLRKGFPGFIESIRKELPGLKIAVTTNGSLLEQSVDFLKNAGVSGVNVSLDTIDPDDFRDITRVGELKPVIRGIEKACASRLPVKINTVLIRGFNDHSIQALLDFAQSCGAVLRLIEFMPLDKSVWSENRFISADAIVGMLPEPDAWETLDTSSDHSSGPAKYYRNRSTGQKLGIIAPVTHHFCETCNRLRITATGEVRACLFSDSGVDLFQALKDKDEPRLRAMLASAAESKPECWMQLASSIRPMSRIGG